MLVCYSFVCKKKEILFRISYHFIGEAVLGLGISGMLQKENSQENTYQKKVRLDVRPSNLSIQLIRKKHNFHHLLESTLQ